MAKKNNYSMKIEIENLTESQKLAITDMLAQWQSLSAIGSSRWVNFYADGDGNFHPKIWVDGNKPSFHGTDEEINFRWKDSEYHVDFDTFKPISNDAVFVINGHLAGAGDSQDPKVTDYVEGLRGKYIDKIQVQDNGLVLVHLDHERAKADETYVEGLRKKVDDLRTALDMRAISLGTLQRENNKLRDKMDPMSEIASDMAGDISKTPQEDRAPIRTHLTKAPF